MEYTEEEKKAIEILKEKSKDHGLWTDLGILHLGTLLSIIERQKKKIEELTVSNKELDKECDRLERKEVKMQKNIDRLNALDVKIFGMRNEKKLLREIASDYLELALKENELQYISGHPIDYIIDLFKSGYSLVNEDNYVPKQKIRNWIKILKEIKKPKDGVISKVTINTNDIVWEIKESFDYEIAQGMIGFLQNLLEE